MNTERDQIADDEAFDFDDSDEHEDNLSSSGTAFSPMRFDVMQRKVRDLLADYHSKDLDPRPSFQRGYVWDKTRASKLIESIMLNVPLPLIYTAEEADGREVVIDGQQRLLSVFSFIQGKFPRDNSDFKLSGLRLISNLNGRRFSDLDEADRKSIERYVFQIIRISKESNSDVKFEIFERLNSGSVTLNAQELRNCVFRGRFNEVLRELAENDDFLKIIGTSKASSRMQDAELVLRFLAFYEKTYLNYKPGLKSFLNNFMEEYKEISDAKAKNFSDTFKHAVSCSFSVFGRHAFRKYSAGNKLDPNGGWERAINRPLFDVVMWGFTRFEKHQVMNHSAEIRDALIDLTTSDASFVDWITSATGDKTKTQFRFELWSERLKEIITTGKQSRSFTCEQKRALFDADPSCKICGQPIHELDDAHVDHIIPYSKGGQTIYENAQLTHRFCNLSKSDK